MAEGLVCGTALTLVASAKKLCRTARIDSYVHEMLPGTDDETVIDARLSVEGDETRLVIAERGIPLAEIGAHGAGWQAHAEDLHRLVQGLGPSIWRQRWSEARERYESIASSL